MPIFSKLPLLKFISLSNCELTEDHLSKIFEDCTTLEEIQLLHSDSFNVTPIKLPPLLKRLKVEDYDSFIDASLCTQLKYL